MFNDLIDTASRRSCSACEQAGRLDGMVTRAAGRQDSSGLSAVNLSQLADSFGRVEKLVAGDIDDAGGAMGRSIGVLGSGALSIDVPSAGRAISSVAASIKRLSSLSGSISYGVAALAGGNPVGALSGIGGSIANAVASASETLGILQKSFANVDGSSVPSMGSASIDLAPLFSGDLADGFGMGLANASSSNGHLLVLTTDRGESFYFNLSTAAYDSLRRQTSYNIASQDRLSRRPALQAVSKGGETITVTGAIFTRKAGADQLNRLRRIGFEMAPLLLTTGYGEALGQWYLTRIDEEQGGLFPDGMPRKQNFTLEFQRYGEDYSDI